jgi:type IV pilus assembly protein PilV
MQPQTTRQALHSSDQRGATLIEALVAVIVLSIGMLGIVSLQTRAIQFESSSLYQSQASILAYDIIDLMRANSGDNAILGLYLHGMNDTIPVSYTNCSGAGVNCSRSDLASYDLYTWLGELAQTLPSGKAAIAVDNSGASPVYSVTIQYDDSRADKSSSYGQGNTIAPKQFTFRTEL